MKDQILERLIQMKDEEYAEFQRRLIPTVEPSLIIGVRTPLLRKYAKELAAREEAESFLQRLPHRYFDENQLHGFIISEEKNFTACLKLTKKFLPYVDNWATCDQLSPSVFAANIDELLVCIKQWITSKRTYTVRFAIGMLMRHFLDENFNPSYLKLVAAVKSKEYYINMMIAWFFATALAKQYDAAFPYLKNCVLDKWTHNKAIQKAQESRRITSEIKERLKALKL